MDSKSFILIKVLDRETGNVNENFGDITDRECCISELEIGMPMIVKFSKNTLTIYTSIVEDFYEDEYGIWVITEGKEYRFNDTLLFDTIVE